MAIKAKWAVLIGVLLAITLTALLALCFWLWWRLDAIEASPRPSWTYPERE